MRYLNYGAGKDRYWTYRHMDIQIEDCVDCLQYLYPQYQYMFELDHSSGHNMERPDGLSTTKTVINLGWGGKQRKMRNTILTANDIGSITHTRSLKVGDTQSMVFLPTDLPPIFDPNVPQYDVSKDDSVTHKFNKAELKEKLEAIGINSDGNVKVLRQRAIEANLPLEETISKIIPGYVGKPKGAAQVACERGFIDLDGKLPSGDKFTLNGTSVKDGLTGVVTINKATSVISILKRCDDFRNEKTQLMYILDLLNVVLRLTPKYHPEIAGHGIKYVWGSSKLRFESNSIMR